MSISDITVQLKDKPFNKEIMTKYASIDFLNRINDKYILASLHPVNNLENRPTIMNLSRCSFAIQLSSDWILPNIDPGLNRSTKFYRSTLCSVFNEHNAL